MRERLGTRHVLVILAAVLVFGILPGGCETGGPAGGSDAAALDGSAADAGPADRALFDSPPPADTRPPSDGIPREVVVGDGRSDDRRVPREDSRRRDGGGDGGECKSPVSPRPGVVVTERGAVSGERAGTTWAFRRIPYAAAPLDGLRWRPPEPRPCWNGEQPPKPGGDSCPQLTADGKVAGNEDCLLLNIWVPTAATTATPQPVLFFIHGGANVKGSSAQAGFDGQRLAEKSGQLVVTINYRLGALAWFAHSGLAAESAHNSSGNYGTLDQLAALSWVQRNIGAFGGDLRHVLVFGESAGALNTCILFVSPLARGLFSAALMESGGCVARSQSEILAFGEQLVEAAGCKTAKDPVACMRKLPVDTLVKALPSEVNVASSKINNYQPNVDGWVLTRMPLEAIAAGEHNQMPLVVGANSDESGASVGPMTQTEYEQAVLEYAGNDQARASAILAHYPVEQYGDPNDPIRLRYRKAFVALSSDYKFICHARRVLRTVAIGQPGLPIYRYYFTHGLDNAGPVTKALGAVHALELLFVFDNLSADNYTPTPAEQALADAIIGYWSRFAATGDPNGGGALSWPAYVTATDPYLQLETTIATGNGVRTTQCDFWDTMALQP